MRKRNVGDSMGRDQVMDLKNVCKFFSLSLYFSCASTHTFVRAQKILRQQDEGIEVLKETLENMYATSNDIGREIDEQEG